MSATKLFPYKMKKGQWFRAEDMTESDIVVIVDTSTETIWFYEGEKSSSRNRSIARELLGQLKRKYVPYRFKRVTNNSPEIILNKIDELKEKSFTGKIPGIKLELKDYSRIFYIMNLIASCFAIFCSVFLWTLLFSKITELNNYLHYKIDINLYLLYIDLNSYFLLASAFIFGVSGFFGKIIQKRLFSTLSIIVATIIFVSFFFLRIWDQFIFYDQSGNYYLIRSDALSLFIICIELLLIYSIIIGFFTAILGLKNIKIFEKVEEQELKALTLPPMKT
ncbi:MAG: hypothetical protein ACP6IY_17575 [Promethearchaeia archaeon]